MALTLTMTDQADGTGATATIAGAGVADTVTVYTQSFDGDLGAGTWATAGTRVGDGTVDATLSTGHYFAYCKDADEVSPVVYFVVTDGVKAVAQQIDEAVQAKLRLIGLDDIDNDRIVIRDVATDRNLERPCIVVSPIRQVMDPLAGVLHQNDVVYSEQVTIFAADNQANESGAKYKLWLQQIARAFRDQELTGVTEVNRCEVVPGPTVPTAYWSDNKYVGALVLKFTTRETRGL